MMKEESYNNSDELASSSENDKEMEIPEELPSQIQSKNQTIHSQFESQEDQTTSMNVSSSLHLNGATTIMQKELMHDITQSTKKSDKTKEILDY